MLFIRIRPGTGIFHSSVKLSTLPGKNRYDITREKNIDA